MSPDFRLAITKFIVRRDYRFVQQTWNSKVQFFVDLEAQSKPRKELPRSARRFTKSLRQKYA